MAVAVESISLEAPLKKIVVDHDGVFVPLGQSGCLAWQGGRRQIERILGRHSEVIALFSLVASLTLTRTEGSRVEILKSEGTLKRRYIAVSVRCDLRDGRVLEFHDHWRDQEHLPFYHSSYERDLEELRVKLRRLAELCGCNLEEVALKGRVALPRTQRPAEAMEVHETPRGSVARLLALGVFCFSVFICFYWLSSQSLDGSWRMKGVTPRQVREVPR